jgi:hypothetical protein
MAAPSFSVNITCPPGISYQKKTLHSRAKTKIMEKAIL